ncbi:SMP-30/gluconolactonase/LRE family protein [Chelatococcus sp. GCM10030263]|uniref:SMP-30/gluconolactonase/LRE family protein n=1 Tax=Chelatococcus sp. GCM10030263 TaxID=3273387 RepID=UPI003607C27E
MAEISCVARMSQRVGESAVWDEEHGHLLWCDIMEPAIYELDLASGERRRWGFEEPVGSFGLTRSGRLVVALGRSVQLFDRQSGRLEMLAADVETHPLVARLNDGKVGTDGAFWVGSMTKPNTQASASLYRVTADGRAERKVEGLGTANGLAWSPDGRIMYHTDSRGPWIDCWTFDPATGAISERRRFRTLSEEEGRPDGGATDSAGNYWSCGISAGCLNCFAPNSGLLARIPVPVLRPTMPCFGGRDLKTLFFTSLTEGLSADDLARSPLSGSVFSMPVDIPGTPVGRFAD